MNAFPILTVLTALPLLGGLVLLTIPAVGARAARTWALVIGGVELLLTFALIQQFDRGVGELQFVERANWIPALGVQYFVGADGLSVLLLLLTALLVPFALLVSGAVTTRVPQFCALVLALQSGLVGTFTAQNFFHWFLFWELSLIPAFLLIRFWGGSERCVASVQFFVYTMVGSVALLLAFLALFLATGVFDFPQLAQLARQGDLAPVLASRLGWYDLTVRQLAVVIFGLAFLGFAVKAPLMPFHAWLPQTYAEAPTCVTLLLTGLMSKMGVYGFLRILLPVFAPQMRWLLMPLLALTVFTIIASACAALAQRDLKRMLGYSSINHLGYCALGLLAAVRGFGGGTASAFDQAAALNGVCLQLFNHGIIAACLFACVAYLEQRSGGARGLDDFGGLRQRLPVFAGLMGIAMFASLGLPGLAGFVGEFLIFKGAFALAPGATALATLGLLLTAVFLLGMFQKLFYGPLNERWRAMPDLTARERWTLAPFIALIFVLGVWPQPLIRLFDATVQAWVKHLSS